MGQVGLVFGFLFCLFVFCFLDFNGLTVDMDTIALLNLSLSENWLLACCCISPHTASFDFFHPPSLLLLSFSFFPS